MKLFELFKRLDLDAQIEVYSRDCSLLVLGIRGELLIDDDLLDAEVYMIVPGIATKIFLDIT